MKPRELESLVANTYELTLPLNTSVSLGRVPRTGAKGQRLPQDGNDGLRLTPRPGAVIDFNGLQVLQPRKAWDPALKGQEAAIIWEDARDVDVRGLDGFGGKPDSEAPAISGKEWEANAFMLFLNCVGMDFTRTHGQSFYGDFAEFVGQRNNTATSTPNRDIRFLAGCSSWGIGRHVFCCHAVTDLVVDGNVHEWFNGDAVHWEQRFGPDRKWVGAKGINGDWRPLNDFRSARQMIRAGEDHR